MKLGFSAGKATRCARGFTLIESLVATLITLVILVSLYSSLSMGFATLQAAREDLRATQVMLEKMETMRLYTWDQLTNSSFMPRTFQVPFDPRKVADVNGAFFAGELTVEDPPMEVSYRDTLKLVTLRLRWDKGSNQKTREMKTYVCRHGLQNYIY
jgi:prepilin-type N-terminal cleavage/methylation domain-containing protein